MLQWGFEVPTGYLRSDEETKGNRFPFEEGYEDHEER